MWELTTIDNAEIEFIDQGTGIPITFIHGAMGEECRAIVNEPALAPFRVIHFHRRGYDRSTSPESPVSVERAAADCVTLLQQRGISRTHFVGQSYGGVIVLEIVKKVPELAHSLTLVEAALPFLIPSFPEFAGALEGAAKLYVAGDKVGAMRRFAAAVVGDTAAPELLAQFDAEYLGGWIEDADAVFQNDMPALQGWPFTEDELADIDKPVLNIRGEQTPPFFAHAFLTLQKSLPHCTSLIVPGVSHTVLQMAPRVVAKHIAEFVAGQQAEEYGRAHSS